jgi:hypothetical protein
MGTGKQGNRRPTAKSQVWSDPHFDIYDYRSHSGSHGWQLCYQLSKALSAFRSIANGFTPAEIPKALAYMMVGLVIGSGYFIYQRLTIVERPALELFRAPGDVVEVHGTAVTVNVDQIRDRPPCDSARAYRQLVHVPMGVDPAKGEIDGAILINQDQIVHTVPGKHKFPLYLAIERPLPYYSSGSWYYEADIYNGCNLLSRLFGQEKPLPATLIPAKISN